MIGHGNSLTALESALGELDLNLLTTHPEENEGLLQEAGVASSSQNTCQVCKAPLRSPALVGGGGELWAFHSPYQKGFGFIAEVPTAQQPSLPYCACCKRSVCPGSDKAFQPESS